MAVRFLADASLNHHIVAACLRREPSMDFRPASSAGLDGVPDPDVLTLAAREGRILVTHDVRTMPQHFGRFLESGQISPGVFVVSQRTPVSEVAEALVLIWEATDPKEWQNRIIEIPLRG